MLFSQLQKCAEWTISTEKQQSWTADQANADVGEKISHIK